MKLDARQIVGIIAAIEDAAFDDYCDEDVVKEEVVVSPFGDPTKRWILTPSDGEYVSTDLVEIDNGMFVLDLPREQQLDLSKLLDEKQIQYVLADGFIHDDNQYIAFEVDSVGGHEGGGEVAERVVMTLSRANVEHATQHENWTLVGYLQINGCYSSYNGTEWDSYSDWFEVTPRPKTVVDWVQTGV